MSVITSTRADYQHGVLQLRSVIIIFFLTISTLPSLHCGEECETLLIKCRDEVKGLDPDKFLQYDEIGHANDYKQLCLACRNTANVKECFNKSKSYCTDEQFTAFTKFRIDSYDLMCSYMNEFQDKFQSQDKCFQQNTCQLPERFKCQEDVLGFLDCSTNQAHDCGSTNQLLYTNGQYLKIKYTDKVFEADFSASSFENCLYLLRGFTITHKRSFNLEEHCKKAFEENYSSPRTKMTYCKWLLTGFLLVFIRCILPLSSL